MAKPEILSHWSQLIDGLHHSPKEFYDKLQDAIEAWKIRRVKLTDKDYPEGGIFSGKRTYLRVKRKDHVFEVCAAPFGRGFFVSWWLCARIPWFLRIPIIGWFLRLAWKEPTFYQIDTATMFQSAVHTAVLEVIDGVTSANGLRALSEAERKPVMKSFFKY